MDEIQAIIARLPAWQGKANLGVEQIAGLTNINYHICVDGEDFVLRVSGQNTVSLGIERECELAVLQAASRAGIGPEVVAFLLPEGHLVTRWVDGRHLDVEEFRTPAHVRRLTRMVKRIHGLPPNGAHFSAFQRAASYTKTARKLGVRLPGGFQGLMETMQLVRSIQQADPTAWEQVCHNDLASVNHLYLDHSESFMILDWEFTGMGDIYYDLATVVYTHDSDGPLPPDLEEIMLAEYFGDVTPFQRRRLLGMKYMLLLFNGLWGLVQYGMQVSGKIPAPAGFDYLKFSEGLFANDIPELQARLLAG